MHIQIEYAVQLRAESLEFICNEHTIILCPFDGSRVEEPTCSLGRAIPARRGVAADTSYLCRLCANCNTIWEIDFSNWRCESSDGGRYWNGHDISLAGYSNCFCRAPALVMGRVPPQFNFCLVHHCCGEHSRLNEKCPGEKIY